VTIADSTITGTLFQGDKSILGKLELKGHNVFDPALTEQQSPPKSPRKAAGVHTGDSTYSEVSNIKSMSQASKQASQKATRRGADAPTEAAKGAGAPTEAAHSEASCMESVPRDKKDLPQVNLQPSKNKQGLGGGGPVSHSKRSDVKNMKNGRKSVSEAYCENKESSSASRPDTLFSDMPSSPSLSRVRRRLCLGTPRLSSTASPTPEPSVPSAFCRAASSMA
jgi:hypothetical protein